MTFRYCCAAFLAAALLLAGHPLRAGEVVRQGTTPLPASPLSEPPPALGGEPLSEPAHAKKLPAPSNSSRPGQDDRTTEIVHLDCGSPLGHRDVTLFANGTVRVREGVKGNENMGLGELTPDELQGAENRLAAEDLSEISQMLAGVDGDWVERCKLVLSLPDREPRTFQYGRYDTFPLGFSRVLKVVEDVAAKVVDVKGIQRLPQGYVPRPRDILRRSDGQLFEVISFTVDDKGVELWGVDQPLTLYVLQDQMTREFVELVSRAQP